MITNLKGTRVNIGKSSQRIFTWFLSTSPNRVWELTVKSSTVTETKFLPPKVCSNSREGKTCSHDAVKPRFPVKVQDRECWDKQNGGVALDGVREGRKASPNSLSGTGDTDFSSAC